MIVKGEMGMGGKNSAEFSFLDSTAVISFSRNCKKVSEIHQIITVMSFTYHHSSINKDWEKVLELDSSLFFSTASQTALPHPEIFSTDLLVSFTHFMYLCLLIPPHPSQIFFWLHPLKSWTLPLCPLEFTIRHSPFPYILFSFTVLEME